jgi:hypothetical protein
VVLTENSDYDFSHNGEVINLRTKSHPRPAGHEDGGKDVSLGL